MNNQVREVLITSKTAKNWKDSFDKKVTELMLIVNKIDTKKNLIEAGELLDIYNKSKNAAIKFQKNKSGITADKPFQFLVFRN